MESEGLLELELGRIVRVYRVLLTLAFNLDPNEDQTNPNSNPCYVKWCSTEAEQGVVTHILPVAAFTTRIKSLIASLFPSEALDCLIFKGSKVKLLSCLLDR